MTDILQIKLTQFVSTGSIGNFSIPLENLKVILEVEVDHVFRAFTTLLFANGVRCSLIEFAVR